MGVSIGHRQYSQHSLKVTHLLSLVAVLTQQCSPSGLKCAGPRCRTTPKSGTSLMNTSSSTANTLLSSCNALPLGNSHNTLPVSSVKQSQGRGVPLAPDPTSVNEMISPVWSVPSPNSLDAASPAVCHNTIIDALIPNL